MYKTAFIFIKPDSTHTFKIVNNLIGQLQNINIEARIATDKNSFDFFQENFPQIKPVLFSDINSHEKSIAFTIGGDGTFLFAAKIINPQNIPIIGINQGNRGFLTHFMPNNIPELIEDIKNDKLFIKNIPLFTAEIAKKDKIYFINEFILQRNAGDKMVKYTLDVENMGYINGRADGIIISTSTGSSAYNLTAGGNIIHSGINALSLTPICPHNLKHKPIIIPPTNIKLTLNNDKAGISFDGFNAGSLHSGDTIEISATKHNLEYVSPNDFKYLEHINSKILC